MRLRPGLRSFLPVTVVALWALAGSGCGWFSKPQTPPVQTAEDYSTRLGTSIDVSLEALLKLSRAELSRMIEEQRDAFTTRSSVVRNQVGGNLLLGNVLPASHLPVFAKSAYSMEAGVSLPGYYKPGTSDPALALHLARFGDVEAALVVAGDDEQLRAKVKAHRGERNYPLEWTQLTALQLESARMKLANGEVEGATELVLLHQQIQAILDTKAASGVLGRTLLPVGRDALMSAEKAWRQPDKKKPLLADDVEAALKAWGEPPVGPGVFDIAGGRADLEKVFGGPVRGQGLTAAAQDCERVLDLLNLPLTRDGVEAVLAHVEGESLAEIQVLYRGGHSVSYSQPVHLISSLLDSGAEPVVDTAGALPHAVVSHAGVMYDATLAPRSRNLGGVVRISLAKNKPQVARLPENPLDLGSVRLDRSFNQNRVLHAPQQPEHKSLHIRSAEPLKGVSLPLNGATPTLAIVNRAGKEDLTASVEFVFEDAGQGDSTWPVAVGLLSAYGPARWAEQETDSGSLLSLTWEEGPARYALRLPYGKTEPPDLVIEDTRGADAVPDRIKAAEGLARAERKARLDAGKPLFRLARWQVFPHIRLGMSREQVLASLPADETVRRYPHDDGFSLLFLKSPDPQATHWPQQMVVRFADNRLVELRMRYLEGPLTPDASHPSLLDVLEQKQGAPVPAPAPWTHLWSDLPAGSPKPFLVRWQDDQTEATYQRDSGGSEVILRDWPADKPGPVELKPWSILSPGIEHCRLGDTREGIVKRWNLPAMPLTSADGGLVIVPPGESPYDALLVYLANDLVTRIVARHKGTPKTQSGGRAPDVTPAIREAWSRDLDRLGIVRRQDPADEFMLQGLGWHDDVTRVRIFGQVSRNGPELYTEWRTWPVPPTTPGEQAGR